MHKFKSAKTLRKMLAVVIAGVMVISMATSAAYADESAPKTYATMDEDFYSAARQAGTDSLVMRDAESGEFSIIEHDENANYPDFIEPCFSEESETSDVAPQIIFNPDGRKPVTDCNSFPGSAVALLKITYENNGLESYATGAFVGRYTILTAGHNIFQLPQDGGGGWAKSIEVVRGGNNSSFGSEMAHTFGISTNWLEYGAADYDYGLVNMRTDGAYSTSYFGMKAAGDLELIGQRIISYGYPKDKEPYGSLWYDNTGWIGNVYLRQFAHNSSTINGDSGGPVMLQSDDRTIVGITSGSANGQNIAVRVTQAVINMINQGGAG